MRPRPRLYSTVLLAALLSACHFALPDTVPSVTDDTRYCAASAAAAASQAASMPSQDCSR